MTARRQWTIVLGVVLLLGAGLLAMTHALGDELFPVTVGSDAPAFTAMTLADSGIGESRSLEDYRGRIVFLNVWATWCPPCRVEMPGMQALHEEFGERGLSIVAVSIDNAGMQQEIMRFAREYGLTFDILHDPEGRIRTIYQTVAVPETFIIGRDGVIIRKVIGAADWHSEANRAAIAAMLDESS
ncbi:MAG: peroxiredoxin family protein [Gemmatimonadaceae bacterium]